MTGPIILPATHPLPAAQRIEFGAWCADKLREAHALRPGGTSEADVLETLLLKARLR